jgi:hypothetical protein
MGPMGALPQTPIVHTELKLHSERQDPIGASYYHKNHYFQVVRLIMISRD